MKKTILNLGKALNKAEQKEVFGGAPPSGDCNAPRVECYNPNNHTWSCKLEEDCLW
ncbi:hypothetical protein C7447_101945 [Tenacibaculum adriaticum]|uniref:Uncharacterized protein n=1 Tax=Tenacibaculum adriaticum TaxID=413713 RepID=A0A5S5E009_9FLAO|nr:hypothetical protein [Tenacibaculum adriaticum]TYQ00333.1 hypothetical protein C7447_101945 [Tenacibaculum adriaticum]